MSDIDTSILDELAARNRRSALRERGRATGRVPAPVVSAPRVVPPPRRRPKPRWMPKGPDMRNTPQAKAAAKASIEARRKREGDLMCEAVLGVLKRMAGGGK